MNKYQNDVISQGLPVVGASVSVYDYNTTTLSSLYSTSTGTSLSNPLTTDDNGSFYFYAADGRYSLSVSGSGIATRTITDILLEDPADASAVVVSGGTVNNTPIGATTPSTGAFTTLSAAANGSPLTVNSTNSSGNKIKLQNAGSDLGFLGADANHVFVASTSGGVPRFYVSNVAGGIGLNTAYAGNGTGITFPATQATSSDANTLDDYEEGTWTPSLGGTATYTTQTGHYTKVGRQVTLWADVTVNVLGTGSTSTISGAPFIPAAGITYHPGSVFFESLAIAETNVVAICQGGSGSIFFAGRATSAVSLDNVIAIFGNGARVRFCITYNV